MHARVLRLRPDVSYPSAKVAVVLNELAEMRGVPQRIVLDNGPELIARALDAWAYRVGVELSHTQPAKPVDNCFVESFHDKLRDECRNTHWFRDLAEATELLEAFRRDYITVRPHPSLGNRNPAEYAELLATTLERESALTIPT